MHGRKSTLAGGLGSSRWGGTSPAMFKQKTNSASKVPHPLASGPGMAGRSLAGPPKIQPVQNPAAKVGFPKHQPPSALSSSAGGSGANPLSYAPRPGHGPNPTKPTPWKPGGWQDWGNPPWPGPWRPGGGRPNLDDWLRPGGRPFPWPGGFPPWRRPPVWQDPYANETPQQRWERMHGDAWQDQQDKEEWGRQYQDQHGGGYIPYWQRGLTQSQIQQQQYQHRQQNQQYISDYWGEQGLTSPDQIDAHKQKQVWERWQRHDPSQMETGQQRQQRRADQFRQDKTWKQAEEEAARQKEQEESEAPGDVQPQGGVQQQYGAQSPSSIQLPGYKQSNKPPGPNEQGYRDSNGQWWVKPKPEVGSGPSGQPDVGFPGQGEPGGGAPPIDPIDVGFPTGPHYGEDQSQGYNQAGTYNNQPIFQNPQGMGYVGSSWSGPRPGEQGYYNAADQGGMGPFDTPQNAGAGWPDMFPGGDYIPPEENPWEGHPTGFDPEADYANTGWGGPQATYAATGAGYYKPAYRRFY